MAGPIKRAKIQTAFPPNVAAIADVLEDDDKTRHRIRRAFRVTDSEIMSRRDGRRNAGHNIRHLNARMATVLSVPARDLPFSRGALSRSFISASRASCRDGEIKLTALELQRDANVERLTGGERGAPEMANELYDQHDS